jgi:hypothetical protein
MLQFMSFVVVLTILSGAVALIVMTIRDASEAVISALLGTTQSAKSVVTLSRRPIRQVRPASPYYAPLRAAA